MNAFAAIKAYANVGLESAVRGADPHELISMLFQGALMAIADAKYQLKHKDLAAKGRSISKAITIIGEGLNASLNHKLGGAIARDLAALYDYMVRRLVSANMENDITKLDEVERLLGEIAGAWNAIRPQVVAGVAAETGSTRPANDYLAV